MSVDIANLTKLYGRLKGIREITAIQSYIQAHVGDDYNQIVKDISAIIEEDCSSFLLPANFYETQRDGSRFAYSSNIQSKLIQFISYLEYAFNLPGNIIEVGSIYNSIKDDELKGRCADILSSPSNFDRVINQASLVLEDRIRTKSRVNDLVGVSLVNKAINSDFSKSILQTSKNPEEHEGIAHICRGIVLTFRNPTHHKIIENYSREDALKFCAFVDLLLTIIDNSNLNNNL